MQSVTSLLFVLTMSSWKRCSF